MKRSACLSGWIAVVLMICLPVPSRADDWVVVHVEGTFVRWEVLAEFDQVTLTVSPPGCKILSKAYRPGEPIVYEVDSTAKDGTYTYELRGIPSFDESVLKELERARVVGNECEVVESLGGKGLLPDESVASGSFTVKDGVIIRPDLQEESNKSVQAVVAPEKAPGEGAKVITAADQVIPDDLIVQQSLCVGFDCVNGEGFGFDTIRLKENNLRIKFDDTSVAAGFPNRDWQLTANDSASGGQSKFSIEDVTGSRVPFTVEAAATTNSLYIDSTGRVGFRTATPVLDIHINTSNTPGIRLEQNSSGGFTAQTWDIAANEANFFVRDVTGGSRLPFRIRPGAPTSSIDISADGDVGIGTASPDASLQVVRSDGTAKLQVEETNGTSTLRNLMTLTNNGGVQFLLDRTDGQNDWQVSNFGASFAVSVPGAATNQMTLTAAGNMTISGTTYAVSSSRGLKENLVPVDGVQILQRLVGMPMTAWNAKMDPQQRHIGPLAEDWWVAFGLGKDDKHVSMTDVGGVALAAIQGLHQVVTEKDAAIAQLEQTVDSLQQQNSELASRLATIEKLLQVRPE